MPTPAAAQRVLLVPTRGVDESALTEVAMVLPDVLDGKPVLLGDEVRAGSVDLVVVGTTPSGRVRVEGRGTQFALSPRPIGDVMASRRLVFDLVVMVDASWSMGKKRSDRPAPYSLVRPALEPFVRQAGDLVRHAALATFSSTPVLREPFAPLASVDLAPLADVRPRGRTALAPAVDFALATLAEGADARNRQAVLLFSDDAEEDARLPDAAVRAARLGANVHVVDVGDEPSDGLRRLARATRGVYAFMPDGVSLGPVFRTLAAEIEAPFEWEEPPVLDENAREVEFEVVLRKMDDDDRRIIPR